MTDTMTPEQRHRCMSHIKGSGTKPELKVRRWLWSHGYRYRLNVKSVPGKPDIVLRTYRTAIFVNGCFWHGHGVKMWECGNASMCESAEPQSGNNLRNSQDLVGFAVGNTDSVTKQEYKKGDLQNSKCCKIPTTNRDFWVAKIRRNQERDQKNYRVLQENGWHVIVIWECQLKPSVIEHTMREVEVILNENMLALYRKHSPQPYITEKETSIPVAAEATFPFGVSQ